MNRFIYMIFFVSLLVTGICSCGKDKGDYGFENKEHRYDGSIIDYFKSKVGVYDSLLLVLELLPDYEEELKEGDITFFAPTNISFELALTNLNLLRKNQNKSLLSLRTLDINHLDSLLSRYIVQDIVNTEAMFYVDGLYLQTKKYSLENKGLMHVQRIKNPSSGFIDGGLIRVFYSDTKRSTFVNQWVRSGSQAVDIRTSNCMVHVLSGRHEFGFGEFLLRMNK